MGPLVWVGGDNGISGWGGRAKGSLVGVREVNGTFVQGGRTM